MSAAKRGGAKRGSPNSGSAKSGSANMGAASRGSANPRSNRGKNRGRAADPNPKRLVEGAGPETIDQGSRNPSPGEGSGPSTIPTAPASAESVRARADALTSALASGVGCLPSGDVHRAEVVIVKAAARTSIAGGHTVVALAGATGSGKSSLFNQLIGTDVARIGARRPTTSTPTAAVWGSASATALLDWLKVGTRHVVDEYPSGATSSGSHGDSPAGDQPADPGERRGPSAGLALDGLVLLDLPDFDTHEETHRLEVDRLLDLVDVFIWVTDPQKYADARLHEQYISRLSAHEAVTMVVLNQADRLTHEMLAACRGDLVRLLAADGVVNPEVVATSAADGSGIVDLRHRISEIVAGQNAAMLRLDSDVRSMATVLRSGVADSEPSLDGESHAGLVDALERAAGIPVILDAVEKDYRRASHARTGWPVTRWVQGLRPAPLKLLRLNQGASAHSRGIAESDVRLVLGRSSLPPATPAARSAVALATRELGDRAGQALPQAWADAVTDAAAPPRDDLADALDQAVLGTSLRARNPLWWTIFGMSQWVLLLAAAAGAVWLTVLAVLGWLQVRLDAPGVGGLAYPFLLFAGGLLVGFLLSVATRAAGRFGARRRKALVATRLRESVARVARDRLVVPVQEVLDRHRMTREHLDAARGTV